MLLAAAVLLFVQIVATATKEAMGAENYVRPIVLDAGVGVVRPSMRCAAVGGRPVWAPTHAPEGVAHHPDGGGRGAVQRRRDAHGGLLLGVHA